MSTKKTPTKDEVLGDLIDFFLDEFSNDPMGVDEWCCKGNWSLEELLPAAKKLKAELRLRD